jgi:bifunctional DNA-binding transcriptional regulator/antitoxin component of YhaV-PrlF toxin-antitoxin module
VIPKDIRAAMDINTGDLMVFDLTEDGTLRLTKQKEANYVIHLNEYGEEELINRNTGATLLNKRKITPMDIAKIVGVNVEVEQV